MWLQGVCVSLSVCSSVPVPAGKIPAELSQGMCTVEWAEGHDSGRVSEGVGDLSWEIAEALVPQGSQLLQPACPPPPPRGRARHVGDWKQLLSLAKIPCG